MAEKKNNNVLYITLVCVGLLLLIIPFFIFAPQGTTTFFGHIGRFGLHMLAFGTALVAGALFSSVVTKAGSSVTTMKVAAIVTSVAIGSAVTYNLIQNTKPKISTVAIVSDSSSVAQNNEKNITTDSSTIALVDSSITHSDSATSSISYETTNSTASKETKSKEKVNLPNQVDKTKNNTVDPKKTNTEELVEECKSFKVFLGSKPLDRKLGISIYDPTKMIQFKNDCGCLLKDASLSLTREGKIIEQKTQNGNYINWKLFRGISPDDKLEVEIKQANCNDSKGNKYLYSFPKPIMTIIYISDHTEYEGGDSKSNTKVAPKDKVEEESNKYGK
jgi:hypothetical protein